MKDTFPSYKTVHIDSLIPYARNSRTHSDAQIAQIAASIREFGFLNPVIVDGGNGIVAGHGRVLAARLLGLDSLPCIEASHLTAAQRRAYVLADNKLALNAGWDNDLLRVELGDLHDMGFDVELTGFDLNEIAELEIDSNPDQGLTDEDAVPGTPEKPVTVDGDIWLLGDHRLMCGDSASIDAVDRLMAGEMACLMVTDPPYGVSYVGKTKDALTLENDDCDTDSLKQLVKDWFGCADAALSDGAYVLATVPAGPLHLIFASDWQLRGWLRQIMVWNKNSMVLGHSEYHYKHEPILFGWKPGPRLPNSDRTKTTVWDFDKPNCSKEHPTMKPVEMWRYAIEQHSMRGGVIYEPFSGSGTTIVAAQQTGRICRAMEIMPKYVDVAVRRWQNFTGKQATLESTGQTFDETANVQHPTSANR